MHTPNSPHKQLIYKLIIIKSFLYTNNIHINIIFICKIFSQTNYSSEGCVRQINQNSITWKFHSFGWMNEYMKEWINEFIFGFGYTNSVSSHEKFTFIFFSENSKDLVILEWKIIIKVAEKLKWRYDILFLALIVKWGISVIQTATCKTNDNQTLYTLN